MVREYKCIDCGAVFTKDTKMRCAAKRCPECNRIRINQLNAEWRQRQRDIAFEQMKQKRLKNNNNG